MKFELVNLKAGEALDFKMPLELLAVADEVIECDGRRVKKQDCLTGGNLLRIGNFRKFAAIGREDSIDFSW